MSLKQGTSSGSRSQSRSVSPKVMLSSCSGKSSRKLKERVPDRFDGSNPWRDYWAHFTACWEISGWSDEESALVLACSLSKSACKVLNPKPFDSGGRERHLTIEELRKRLDIRYGPGKLADYYLAQLETRRQGPTESIQELGESINELVQLAYPDVSNELRERLSVMHFRDSILEAEIRTGLFRTRSDSLDEAIKFALEAESIMELEARREKQGYVRSVHVEKSEMTYSLSERLDKIEKLQNELIKLMSTVKAEQQLKPRPQISRMKSLQCFNCREVGHIRKKCPYQRHTSQPSVKIRQSNNHHERKTRNNTATSAKPQRSKLLLEDKQPAILSCDGSVDEVADQGSTEVATWSKVPCDDMQESVSVTEVESTPDINHDIVSTAESTNDQVSNCDAEVTVMSEVTTIVKSRDSQNVCEDIVEGRDVDQRVSKDIEDPDVTLWNSYSEVHDMVWSSCIFVGFLCALWLYCSARRLGMLVDNVASV